MNTTQQERFLKREEVTEMTGLPRSSIYELMRANKFPQNLHIGGKRVFWLESEIQEWINEHKENRNAQTVIY